MKPLALDLCCGLGGWTEGLLAEGFDVVGFDVERHEYGDAKYPAQLVLQDVLTLSGKQFRGKVSLIVASPPCHKYSYMAMPWTRAKELAKWYRDTNHPERLVELNAVFDACVRIGREAECPIVIENVRGAQPWVGRSRWNYGSFHLFGDVPELMPMTTKRKIPGFRFDGSGKSFQPAAVEHTKNSGGSWLNVAHNTTSGKGNNPDGRKVPSDSGRRTDLGKGARFTSRDCGDEGVKQRGGWFGDNDSPMRQGSSKSSARKRASAMIAKIPLPLSRYIAATYKPRAVAA